MYIVVRQAKSVGVAILLTIIFGPLGLFYASITGGLIMTFGPLLITIGCLLFSGYNALAAFTIFWGFIWTYGLFGWLISILWAIDAVLTYNKKLVIESTVIGGAAIPTSPHELAEPVDPLLLEESRKRTQTNLLIALGVMVAITIGLYLYIHRDDHPTNDAQVEYSLNEDAPIYAYPNIKSTVISQVKQGESVEVVDETVYFVKVKWEQTNGKARYGFIRKSLLANYTPKANAYEPNQPLTGSMLSLNKDNNKSDEFATSINEQISEEPLRETEEGTWRVVAAKTYFHLSATETSKKRGYLVKGDIVRSSVESDNFIYATFENARGKSTTGYILKKDLKLETDEVATDDL